MVSFLADLFHPERLSQQLYIMVFILFGAGLFFLFFAYLAESASNASVSVFPQLGVQVIAFILGFIALHIFSRIPYWVYKKYIFIISALSTILMLLLVTPLAIERNGAIRWIDLGVLQFQPSEVMKLTFIFIFAALCTTAIFRDNRRMLFGATAALFAILGITGIAQPDYGGALIIILSLLGIACVAKLPKIWWITVLSLLCATGLFFSFVGPSYVTTRIQTFYDIHFGELTSAQRYGDAYHALQNLEAVRVGGIFGQGPGYVAQSSHLDIPEIATDSIFALVAAETGFLGSVFFILLFIFFFTLCYRVAATANDAFGQYLAIGIAVMLAVQFFINILVVLGLPATGIPMIFFSRGGSSLILTMAAIGILLNIVQKREKRRSLSNRSFA